MMLKIQLICFFRHGRLRGRRFRALSLKKIQSQLRKNWSRLKRFLEDAEELRTFTKYVGIETVWKQLRGR